MQEWWSRFCEYFTIFFSVNQAFQMLCASLSATLSIGHLHLKKKTLIHQGISIVALFALMIILSSTISSFFDSRTFAVTPYIIIFSILIPGIVYIGIFNHASWKITLIKMMLYISSAYVVTEIGHRVNLLTYFDSMALNIFIRCLPSLLMLLSAVFIGRYNVNRYNRVPLNYLILSSVSFVGLFVVTLLMSRYQTDVDPISGGVPGSSDIYLYVLFILVLVIFLAMELGVYLALYFQLADQDKIQELMSQSNLNDASAEMLKLNEESIERASLMRHDMKNHYAYISRLLDEQKYEEVRKYINDVEEENWGDFHIIDCGNRVISSIMNLEYTKARLAKVPFTYLLVVPSELPMKENDLCSLLTNLVDNAIEGSSFEGREPSSGIDVRIHVQGGYLRITVTNPTDKDHLDLKSHKNETGHGYGIRITKNIVTNYHGYVNYEVKEHVFRADALLEMTAGEEHNDD